MQKLAALFLAAWCVASASAFAQTASGAPPDVAAELRALRAELQRTRQEIDQLRTEVSQMRSSGARAVETPPGEAQRDLRASVEILQAQVAEQAQTKVESSSRLPVRLFGTIHSVTAFNTGEANWLESPNIVGPRPEGATGSWTSTLRQTRLGIAADGVAIGDWRANGVVSFDFFGGVPAFQTGQAMGLPRLLYAYSRFEREGTAIEVGQDEMILAPRNPTSLSSYAFPQFYRSGNLYLRVPQARVETRVAAVSGGELRATAGIVAPIGGDFSSTAFAFVPPPLAGERSRHPGVQARVAWQQGTPEHGASLGVSGHYGRERLPTRTRSSWVTAFDGNLQTTWFGLSGEAFFGDNLDAFGGALGQAARSGGGFIEGRLLPRDRWEVTLGFGTDRPEAGPVLSRNTSAVSGVTFRITPEVATAFEYRWLETRAQSARRQNHHVDWTLVYGF